MGLPDLRRRPQQDDAGRSGRAERRRSSGHLFVVATGYNEKYLPLLAEAEAAGHQIAFHSASHEYSDIYRSPDAYWQGVPC